MLGKMITVEIVLNLLAGEAGKRIDLQASVSFLQCRNIRAKPAMISLATGNPGFETGQRIFERQNLADVAAPVRIAAVQRSSAVEHAQDAVHSRTPLNVAVCFVET